MSSKFMTVEEFDSLYDLARQEVPTTELALQEVSTVDLPPLGDSDESMQQSLNRYLDQCEREAARSVEASVLPAEAPRIDVGETDEVVVFSVDLPGMDEKDVDVWISPDVLTIRGHRPAAESGIRSWHVRERSCADVERVVLIPEGVDTEDASMRFSNGVLTVRISKLAGKRKGERRVVFAS